MLYDVAIVVLLRVKISKTEGIARRIILGKRALFVLGELWRYDSKLGGSVTHPFSAENSDCVLIGHEEPPDDRRRLRSSGLLYQNSILNCQDTISSLSQITVVSYNHEGSPFGTTQIPE